MYLLVVPRVQAVIHLADFQLLDRIYATPHREESFQIWKDIHAVPAEPALGWTLRVSSGQKRNSSTSAAKISAEKQLLFLLETEGKS